MIKDDNANKDEILKDPKRIQEDLAEFEKELEDELKPIDERSILGVKPATVPAEEAKLPEAQAPEVSEPIPSTKEETPIPALTAEPTPPPVISSREEKLSVVPAVAEMLPLDEPAREAPLVVDSRDITLEETRPISEVPDIVAVETPVSEQAAVPIEVLGEEPIEEPFSPEDQEIDRAFSELLEQYLPAIAELEVGRIIQVPVVEVKADYVLVDVGDKAEGIIDINEFVDSEGEINISVGDVVDVLIEGRDDESGQIIVSHSLAEQQLSVLRLQKAWENKAPVRGIVSQVVRGGLIVKYGSVPCFLPASQVDVVRVEDLSQFLKREIDAYVLEFDLSRNRIILSRRKLLQEKAEERRKKFLESIAVGELVAGRVKNILDFGAFVDLGPMDGFIPREEVSWDRGVHPSRYLREGRTAKYKIIAVNREEGKITLSRKQARANPWETVDKRYPRGTIIRGVVASLTNYGAFVRLEEGITGMIHASDLSWAKGMKRPSDFLKEGDNIKAVILDIDKEKRRLSLGLKQITADPWDEVERKYPVGARVSGRVTYVTKYGVFVRLDEEVEGMVHVSSLTWEKHAPKPSKMVKPGQDVDVVVLELNREKRRISLGMKQLTQSPFERFLAKHQVGSYVQGTVVNLTPFGAFVDLGDGVEGLVHISQLALERINDPKEAVKVGERVECKIVKIDTDNEKISLSRKDYLREIERREVASYVSREFKGGVNIGELLRKLDISALSSDRPMPQDKPE
jgi:small subunit ribosomal protein S1